VSRKEGRRKKEKFLNRDLSFRLGPPKKEGEETITLETQERPFEKGELLLHTILYVHAAPGLSDMRWI
jgi:hypothetical protein